MIGMTRSSTNCRMLSRTARSSSDSSESILKKSSMEAGWGGLKVKRWNGGTVERWNGGTVERWNGGTVERRDGGTNCVTFHRSSERRRAPVPPFHCLTARHFPLGRRLNPNLARLG